MRLKSFCGLVLRFTLSEFHSNVFSIASLLNSDRVSLAVSKSPSPNHITIGMFFRVTKSRSDTPNDLPSKLISVHFQYILILSTISK